MKWNFKPLRLFKVAATFLSVFTMCLTPVAYGKQAETQSQKVNRFLKTTGLTTKKMTIGEFWRSVRHVYPRKMQSQIDLWVSLNRNEPMPKIEANTFKDRDGKEQVRLVLTGNKKGQNVTLTFTGDDAKPMKVNGTTLTRKELTQYNKFEDLVKKLAGKDPAFKKGMASNRSALGKSPVMSYKDFSSLTARQKAEYLFKMRLAMMSAQRVYKARYGAQALNEINKKYEWALQFLFGEEAEAASTLTGKPCIYAGYLTLYGENGSCGGEAEGARDFSSRVSKSMASCAGRDVACNPMVYGYDLDGSTYCVPHADRKYATRECNKQSPLQKDDKVLGALDKKRIIESYLKKRGKNVNLQLVDGKIAEAQYAEIASYLKDLNKFIDDAVGECSQAPLVDIQKQREDQASACEELRIRAFDLQKFAAGPSPLPSPPAPLPAEGTQACDIEKPGSEPVTSPKPGCSCPEGTEDDGVSCPVVVVETGGGDELPGSRDVPEKGEKKDDDDDCTFCLGAIWPWVLGAGIVGGLIWWMLRDDDDDDKKNNTYVPPVAVDPGTGTPTTPTNPITPVPTPVCTPPKVVVNNVCTDPVIVTPPAPASEGGNLETVPGMGIGVRGVK